MDYGRNPRQCALVRNADERRCCDVGGKNASLGELYSDLAAEGVKVPNGFALTAQSYYDALSDAQARTDLHACWTRWTRPMSNSFR